MTTIETAVKYYRDNYCKRDGTRRSYGVLLTKFEPLMKINIEEITPATIVKAFNATELKENSKKLYYFNLKTAIYRFCSDHRIQNSINLNGLFKGERAKLEVKYLTLAEVKQIFEFDPVKMRKKKAKDLFLLMCLSGMSVADAFAFDPEKHVTPDGKYFAYNRKKTGSLCLIPVIDDAAAIIEKYKGCWPIANEIGSIRTFVNHCEWIGKIVGKRVSPHVARKTMGCIFLEFGFSMTAVSYFLGHSSILTTEKHYARVSRDKIDYETERIPKERLSISN